MTKTIESLFYYLATFTPAAPAILYFAYFKILAKQKIIQLVSLYSLIELLTNVLALTLSPRLVAPLYSIFTLLEYGVLSAIFFFLIQRRLFKNVIIFFSICFTFFWVVYQIYGDYKRLDSIPIGVSSILLLSYSFGFLYEQLADLDNQFLYNRYSFWICAGIMFYLAGSFFSYLFSNQLDKPILEVFWMFTNICATIKNISFLIAILLFSRRGLNGKFPRTEFIYNPIQ